MRNYAGSAQQYPIEVQITDDGDPENATIVNTTQEGILDRTAYLYANRMTVPQWNYPVVPGGLGNTITNLCWDSSTFGKRWLLVAKDASPKYQVWASSTGISFYQLGVNAASTWGFANIAVNPTTGLIVIIGVITATATWFKLDRLGAAYTHGSLPLGGGAFPTLSYSPGVLRYFQGVFVFIGGGTKSGGTGVKTSLITSIDGATWTDHSDNIPSPGAVSWSRVTVAQSSTRMIALSRGGPSPNFPFSIWSADGITWSIVGFNIFPSSLISEVCYAAAWSEVDQLFMASISDNGGDPGGTYSRIYTSPDGAFWTLRNGTDLGAYGITGLSCIGNTWVASTNTGNGGIGVVGQVLVSNDKGVTWALASGEFDTGGAGLLRPSVFGSGNQLIIANDAGVRSSLIVGDVPAGV